HRFGIRVPQLAEGGGRAHQRVDRLVVSQALAQGGPEVGQADRLSVPVADAAPDGERLLLSRFTSGQITGGIVGGRDVVEAAGDLPRIAESAADPERLVE